MMSIQFALMQLVFLFSVDKDNAINVGRL